MVSQKFKATIKLSDLPAYKIAQRSGLDPSTLSKLICGIVVVKPQDPRVLRVGEILGLKPEDCFEGETASDVRDS